MLVSWFCPVSACLSIIDIDFTSYKDKNHFVLKGPNPYSDGHQEDDEVMALGEGW
jgi:hypothetical protein